MRTVSGASFDQGYAVSASSSSHAADRIACIAERDEECIALRVNLNAATFAERRPEQIAMLGEH